MNIPVVTYEEALSCFDKPANMARAFDVSRAAVAEWKVSGRLPPLRAMQFERMRQESAQKSAA